ncbi:MAG: hypothetical protein JXR76_09950 [Deltaproteobacteria bacterium]|nr:hypothetical protein [Deltaproteobacteria bacterium]
MAGGATCVTHAAMQKMFRDMSRFRRDRRAYVQAHRKMNMVRGEQEHPNHHGEHRIQNCFHTCGQCGYLSVSSADNCAGCGASQWLDLNDVTVSETLRSNEENTRKNVPANAKALSFGVHATVYAAVAIGIPLVINWPNMNILWHSWELLWVASPALFLFIGSYLLTTRRFAKLLGKFKKVRPIRWYLPVDFRRRRDIKTSPQNDILGHCQGDEMRQSPFSVQPCLGYKVSVLFDVHGDARPPEWVLEESRNAPMTINQQFIAKDKLVFQVTGTLVDASSSVLEQKCKQFLRQRGLFLEDGDFWFYEAVLKPEDLVTIAHYPNLNLGILRQFEDR